MRSVKRLVAKPTLSLGKTGLREEVPALSWAARILWSAMPIEQVEVERHEDVR